MASIAELNWTSSEDLFREVDLDCLYARQLKVIGAENNHYYPYLVLVHTGKITIGIDLGHGCKQPEWTHSLEMRRRISDGRALIRRPFEESSD